MAVEFGNASSVASVGGVTSLTWAHDATGDDILLMCVELRDSEGASMTATYDGVSMSEEASISDANQFLHAWILADPTTDSDNIVCSWTTSRGAVATAVSLNGSAGTIGTPVTDQGPGTDADFDATGTLNAGDLLVGWGTTLTGGSGGGLAVGPGTERATAFREDSLDMSCATHTSSPITWTKTGVDVWDSIGIPVDVGAAGPANVKSWNGLALSSIKSINGLAIADIKSINGLA